MDRLVVEQKQELGKTMTRAQLNFTSQPSGVVSWLAPPAPMGALEFVSPQAYGVASAVTKDALGILDEILAFGGDHLQEFQSQTGVDARRDLAEPLGGEFVIAMDGPFLPIPSWKVVAEVYDSARLQNSIERLVAAFNNTAAQKGIPNVTLTSEAVSGQVYYRLTHGSGHGSRLYLLPRIRHCGALTRTRHAGASISTDPVIDFDLHKVPVDDAGGRSGSLFGDPLPEPFRDGEFARGLYTGRNRRRHIRPVEGLASDRGADSGDAGLRIRSARPDHDGLSR